jgi:hypothetical protein
LPPNSKLARGTKQPILGDVCAISFEEITNQQRRAQISSHSGNKRGKEGKQMGNSSNVLKPEFSAFGSAADIRELLRDSKAAVCQLGIMQREAYRRGWCFDDVFADVMDGAIDYAIQQIDALVIAFSPRPTT